MDEHDHFFPWPYFHEACFVSNVQEKVVDLTTLNIMRTTRVMSMKFCIVNTPKSSFLFGCAKYFACFSKFLPVKRLMVILWKDRKLQVFTIFRCQDISKNGLHSEIMLTLQSTTSLKATWKIIAPFKFWFVMYKFTCIFTLTLLYITVHFLSYLKFHNLMSLYLLRERRA